jgi:hypothetical protein
LSVPEKFSMRDDKSPVHHVGKTTPGNAVVMRRDRATVALHSSSSAARIATADRWRESARALQQKTGFQRSHSAGVVAAYRHCLQDPQVVSDGVLNFEDKVKHAHPRTENVMQRDEHQTFRTDDDAPAAPELERPNHADLVYIRIFR